MKKFGLEPIKRRIDKYEEALKKKSLTIEQQKEILQELKARPYRFVYDETLETPIDIYKNIKVRYRKTLTLELDNGHTITFKIKEAKFSS